MVAAEDPVPPLAPLRILIVDDQAINQKILVHLLNREGHHTRTADNGRQAVELLERERFDLVLMDVQMPEMDGLEATAAIRARERQRGGHVPIVAVTTNTAPGDREKCLEAGMDDYLPKPVQK